MTDEEKWDLAKQVVHQDLATAHAVLEDWVDEWLWSDETKGAPEKNPHYGALMQAAMMSVLANKKTD